MNRWLETIQRDVEGYAKCVARHVESVPVREMFGDEVVWEGVVEGFELDGHSQAKKAYAWLRPDDGEITVVLGIDPPVSSASNAVRVALAAMGRAT